MGSAPAAVSFLCSAILATFIVVRRVRENVAKLALVSWLLGCNMVHGINALVWSSNVDLKGLGWCDLVTKLVLATTIGVSGACLCTARYLELVSSSRSLPLTAKASRNRRIFDAIICYLIPFLYLPLFIVGQDYRFDLVKGIGCVASVHPSPAAAAVVWLPQIVISILSILLSGIAIHNSSRHPASHFTTHLESRSSLTARIWSRTLTISMALSIIILVVLVFSLLSSPMQDSWISWRHVHQHISQVNIPAQDDQITGIKIFWWGLRVVTLCYIVLVLVLGEESRDIFRYLDGVKKASFTRPFITACDSRTENKVSKQPSSFPPSFNDSFDKPKRPQTLELKSGWDDDLEIKSPGFASLSPRSWKKARPSPPTSPSPSPSSRTLDDFITTSMPYLGSPMGGLTGFSTPIVPPPPVYQSARKMAKVYADYDASQEVGPAAPMSPVCSSRPILFPKRGHQPAESKASNIITVLQEQWPSPPLVIPSPIPSDMTTSTIDEVSPARPDSPALSITERRQPCSYVASSAASTTRPFEDSCLPCSSPASVPVRSIKRSLTGRGSLQSVRSLLGKDRAGQGSGEVIHMSVVQETV